MSTPLIENTMSEEMFEYIIQIYQAGKSLRAIEKEVPYGRAALSRMLKRNNIEVKPEYHPKTYHFNENYFDNINTPDKAYWLGLLYADGCIVTNQYGQQSFKISLQERDEQLLFDLKEDLDSTYPIRKDYSKHRKNPKHCVQSLSDYRSQHAVDRLKQLGCLERKSLILKFPSYSQVPENLVYHFIRGYFDGDGSIYCSKDHWYINIVGTKEFITKLSSYFTGGSVIQDKRKENSWYFSLGGNLQVIQAYKLLYKDAHRYMQRKYDKFQELLLKYSEN